MYTTLRYISLLWFRASGCLIPIWKTSYFQPLRSFPWYMYLQTGTSVHVEENRSNPWRLLGKCFQGVREMGVLSTMLMSIWLCLSYQNWGVKLDCRCSSNQILEAFTESYMIWIILCFESVSAKFENWRSARSNIQQWMLLVGVESPHKAVAWC